MHTLYLCYFGLREPLVQTQVLPYLRELVAGGIRVSLLTFEPDRKASWSVALEDEWRRRLTDEGIDWFARTYHKRPSLPATTFDVAVGAWTAVRLARRSKIDMFHARAHVAAVMGLLAKWLVPAGLVFDIRGLLPEEYADAGHWSRSGLKYRLLKRVERSLFAASDGFVVLTERARDVLFPGSIDADPQGRPIEVIPCCVDFDRFRRAEAKSRDVIRAEFGFEGRRVIVYVGALGGLYPIEVIAGFLATAREQDPSTLALILTQGDAGPLVERLRGAGLDTRDYHVARAGVEEVPFYLKAADLALSVKRECFSQICCSPTKIAEYLATGLPVITSPGIGDTDTILREDRVGVVIAAPGRDGYLAALREAESLRREPGIAERCRASATRRFDLGGVGGVRYRRIYHRLAGPGNPDPVASSEGRPGA